MRVFRSTAVVSIREASPLGLPYTRSRAPLRRRAPIAWLARSARSHLRVSVRFMRQLLAAAGPHPRSAS